MKRKNLQSLGIHIYGMIHLGAVERPEDNKKIVILKTNKKPSLTRVNIV